jgi:2-oxoglutarate dehydrogenase E2 component (dihydrolipoamide succinyltransferase)
MKEDVKVPSVGESIVEGVLMTWYKKSGDHVITGEDLYEFETEKASVTVPSPFEGILEIIVQEGTKVAIDQVVARIDTGAGIAPGQKGMEKIPNKKIEAPRPAQEKKAKAEKAAEKQPKFPESLSPAVRRVVREQDIDVTGIQGTGKNGRITKDDVLKSIEQKPKEQISEEMPHTDLQGTREIKDEDALVKRVEMTPVRKSIARRLVAARQEAAHLTTFNEINMEILIDIRKKHQKVFEKRYGIKLGFMSFFVKASVEALKEFPVINSRIEGDDIVYYNFYDIGVAVSTDRGLLVPIIRNADTLSFAEIEEKIADLAERAKNKKITLPELQGGTFSITNGGIFGSLMSTPIPNHPQPAILGMHAIQDRPVAIQGEVKIKPMMYVAVTYDHRIIDGRDAVSFLFRIKEYIEDPEELLLNK